MATVTNEQVGVDEEDMYEDSGPMYIHDQVNLIPERGCSFVVLKQGYQ